MVGGAWRDRDRDRGIDHMKKKDMDARKVSDDQKQLIIDVASAASAALRPPARAVLVVIECDGRTLIAAGNADYLDGNAEAVAEALTALIFLAPHHVVDWAKRTRAASSLKGDDSTSRVHFV